jgi:Bifunctional DNA primase/polymerase, N-terminal
MPEDAHYMLGYDEQIVAVVPSRDLVIVRLGLTREGGGWNMPATSRRSCMRFHLVREGGLKLGYNCYGLLTCLKPRSTDSSHILHAGRAAMNARSLDRSAEEIAEQRNTAEVAKRYLARRWSVLPLRPRDKRPLIRWEHLQIERPSEVDIAEWFRRWPDANIGIVTGEDFQSDRGRRQSETRRRRNS